MELVYFGKRNFLAPRLKKNLERKFLSSKNKKKSTLKNFLYFQKKRFFLYFEKLNFLVLRLKRFLYFLKEKPFLYFGKLDFPPSSQNKKKPL